MQKLKTLTHLSMSSSPSDFHITQLTLVNMSVCASGYVCVCVPVCFKREIYAQRAARVEARQASVWKGACILSLCGLCCSDKFRVCPDFLESLIPKIPPGDSEHPVHMKSCDHDHTHMDTNSLPFTTQANHFLSWHTNKTNLNPKHIINT